MRIFDYIFPKKCFSCGKESEYLCADCLKCLRVNHFQRCPVCFRMQTAGSLCRGKCKKGYYFDNLIVCTEYGGLIKRLIIQFKYKFCEELSEMFSNLLIRALAENISLNPGNFFITAVPLSKAKMNKRGFNQAAVLAEKIAYYMNSEYLNPFFREKRPDQAKLNRKDRLNNLHRSIHIVNYHENISHNTIILVDDVATTLSTLNECSRALKLCGAGKIICIVLSRSG